MSPRISRAVRAVSAAALLLPVAVLAQSLGQVVTEGEAKAREARASQERIDAIVDAQQERLITYRALLKQAEGLQQYNEQLATQVEGQLALIQRFDSSIQQVATIERQMLPLTTRMLETLEAFVELDKPFHVAERADRLAGLNSTLAKADVNVAEKFRQVLEAYQIETEYCRKIDTYQDIVDFEGQALEVDVLRFGRIALVAQSKDTAISLVWNPETKAWERLDSGTYRNSLRRGILMANKQASIDMVTLPIPAPEAVQ
jgi:hypothetical protein